MEKIIVILVAILVLATGLTSISMLSIFGLHARIPQTEFYVPPNKDIYECRLQWIHENDITSQRMLTCLYKCEDTHGTFEWYEKSWDNKGCKIKTRVYKTEVG